MQFYSMQATADRATLELREAAIPEPGPQQMLVQMRAASLNRGEFILGHGLQKAGTAKAIGMEGSGEIAALGSGVSELEIGQRVMGRCAGAFAEYAVMDVREAIPIPVGLSWEEAAAIPLTFLVVYDMLVTQGKLLPGEWLLVTGVTSGVGVAALQTAKALGAKVIGTSGSQDKLDRLKASRLDLGLCTRAADFCAAVTKATDGKGVNLVVNTVGGSMFAECVRSMAFEGRLATVGYVDGILKGEIDIQALHAKRLTLFGVSNKMRNAEQRAAAVPGFVADLLPAIAAGRIRPLIDKVYPFDQLEAAKAYMESNRHVGKIILAMPTSIPGKGRS
jgi:NADPH:quinone reductase-like Zn-dependent oxidoreductase